MTVYNDLSFTQAVQVFLDSATWLDNSHQVAITGLEKCAASLDTRMSASLMAELTKLYRLLINAKPDGDTTTDALDDFLAGLQR